MEHKNRACRTALAALVSLALFGLPLPSAAFQVTQTDSGLAIKWPVTSAGFYFNPAGAPAGALAAVQAAMSTWTAVTTSNFSFIYKSLSSSTVYGIDGKNIISFGSLADIEGADANTLSLNTFFFDDTTGFLQDSDIRFNTEFAWATDGGDTAYDVQTIAVHELGHALALDDLYGGADSAKVMYGYCTRGEIKRALTEDDTNGIAYLYPLLSGTPVTVPDPCPAEYVLGSESPELESLRALRDRWLSRSAAGRLVIRLYYENDKTLRAALEKSPALKTAAGLLCRAAAGVMKARR